jgi:hypothetical protein
MGDIHALAEPSLRANYLVRDLKVRQLPHLRWGFFAHFQSLVSVDGVYPS